MTLPRFLQIHTLHNYSATLLNRDDAGLAKRLPYGNAIRTRISSQCLKRHWRVADDAFALDKLGFELEKRSTYFLDEVRKYLLSNGIPENVSLAAVDGLAEGLKLKRDEKKKDKFKTKEVLFLGVKEVEYLNSFTLDIAKQHTDEKTAKQAVKDYVDSKPKDGRSVRENLKIMFEQCGLASALFGRMVTSDVLASRDAAVYVAHAFTVHEAQVDLDYFTAVDDILNDSDEAGSAGIFDTELASGLYYGYTVVDVPQLVANLEGVKIGDWASAAPEQRALAARVVQSLLHLVATVSPGAKRGSTAPFEWAKFMLVEAGDWQPRSLAGAFHSALSTRQPQLRQAAVQALGDEITRLDAAYGAPLARRFLAVDDVAVPGAQRLPLKELADWAHHAVAQAQVEV